MTIRSLAQIGGDKNLPYKVLSESEAVSEYVLNKGGVSVSKDTVLINFRYWRNNF